MAAIRAYRLLPEHSLQTISRAIKTHGSRPRMFINEPGHSAPQGCTMMRMEEQKPIAFEARWRAASIDFQALVNEVLQRLQEHAMGSGRWKRARRPKDRAKFARAVELICCNLYAVSLLKDDLSRSLAVKLGNDASKVSNVFGKPFNDALALMAEHGYITIDKGYKHPKKFRWHRLSCIRATTVFSRHLRIKHGWTALRLEEEGECSVVLKDKEAAAMASESWLRGRRVEVDRINHRLQKLDLGDVTACTHAGDSGHPAAMLMTPHHRTVRRIFNGTYDRGGRLFGGQWQTMPRAARFKLLRMDGEPVVNVDFCEMFVRLAYARAGIAPPPGDLYDVTGKDFLRSDWLQLRAGRKRMINALLFATKAIVSWPGQTFEDRAEIRRCFPNGLLPREICAAIKQRHAPIAAEWFEKGRGLELMRLESDILVAVLLRLFEQGVDALPLHDSVIVANNKAGLAKRIMETEALRLSGAAIPVKIEVL